MTSRSILAGVLLIALGFGGACGKPAYDSALVLALSVFPVGPDGKGSLEPGDATLVVLRHEGGWTHEVVTDPESNVFHKALAFAPPGGEPGILTISGDAARLKLWRVRDGTWSAETLWAPSFGGSHDRLRDMELADVDGDGALEVVIATHDQGIVAVADVDASGVEVREMDRTPSTFVHEVEVGDIDGDGEIEILATPSQPNRLDGDPQSGRVKRYAPTGDDRGSVFADLGTRHAKEVLVADLIGAGHPQVYVAVEGHVENGRLIEPAEIRQYMSAGSEGRVIATLDDRLCRFLVAADVEGNGRPVLIAAPFKSGLWMLRPQPGAWEQILIDRDSSSFEHATAAYDLDGDGKDEIYVAADDQGAVRRYVWNGTGFDREEIFRYPPALKGFTWNITAVPVDLTR
jgi:hypothetical protein